MSATYPGADFYSHRRMCERARLTVDAAERAAKAAVADAMKVPSVARAAAAQSALDGVTTARTMAEVILGAGWQSGEQVPPTIGKDGV